MADETIEFDERGSDKVAGAYRKVGKAAKDAGDDIEKGAKDAQNAEKSSKSLTEQLGKLAAAYVVIKDVVIEGVEAFADQQAALGRLQRSFRTVGASSKQYSATMAELDRRSKTLGVSFNEQVDGLTQLIDQTGSLKLANRDLALAIDIASQENIELAQAVEMLRKARNGEIEELKNLDGINTDLAKSLAQVTDSSKRGEKAILELEKAYKGAAEENKGFQEQIESLKKSIEEELLPAIGELVSAFVDKEEGLLSIFKDFGGYEGPVDTASKNISRLGREIKGVVADPSFGKLVGLLTLSPRMVAEGWGLLEAPEEARGGTPNLGEGTFDIADLPRGGGGRSGYGKSGVPKPKKKKKKGKARERDDGSGAAIVESTSDEEIFGTIADVLNARADQQAIFRNEERQRQIAAWKEEQQAFQDHQKEMTAIMAEAEAERAAEQKAAQQRALELRNAALEGGIAVAQSAADSFIESEAAKAAISAAIEGARSLAAFATGNIPGGIAHAAAAAQFGIAAAAAGKSPPGGGGKGGGSARRAARDRRREDVGLLGEQSRSSTAQSPRPLVVNINSAFPPSPEQAAALADAVQRDARRQV